MKRILTKYIINNFLKCFMIVFCCFYVIVALLELMDVIRQYYSSGCNPTILQVMKITSCRAIVSVCSFFSFILLLSTIVFFTLMHNRNEINIMRCSGISTHKILGMIFIATSIISLFYISTFDTVSKHAYRIQDQIAVNVTKKLKQNEPMLITNKGMWFKDTYDGKEYFVYARHVNRIKKELNDVRICEFDKNFRYIRTINANISNISDGFWKLSHCDIINSEGHKASVSNYKLPTHVSFKALNMMTGDPKSLSFWSIMKYSKMCEKVGLSSIRYMENFCARISTILMMFAFATLATVFCLSYNRRLPRTYINKIAVLVIFSITTHFINTTILSAISNDFIAMLRTSLVIPITLIVSGIMFINDVN